MKPKISIVIPVYNEENNLQALFDRLIKTMDGLDDTYEIILVNDGSRDQSMVILTKLYKARPDVHRVINFKGNFGQHMAVMAGFEHCRGDIIVTLDADLQNPPEEIPKLVAKMKEGFDLVSGVRQQRKDSWFRTNVSKMINWIRDRITNIRMTDHGCMLRAYDRNVVELMVVSGERVTFIPALAYSFSSNPTEIQVAHDEREHGQSKYRLYDLIRLNFDLMTGFSLIPLQIFTAIGFIIAFISALLSLYILARRIFIGPEADGLFTLFMILFFFIGILFIGLGITGEYIGRIYQEVRHRPRFAIQKILEKEKSQ